MFRFSIRELMLVTLVVGLGIGWFLQWRTLAHRHARRGEYVEALKDELRLKMGENEALNDAMRAEHGNYTVTFKKGTLRPDLQDEWFYGITKRSRK